MGRKSIHGEEMPLFLGFGDRIMDGTTNRHFREESFYEEGNIDYIVLISGNSAGFLRCELEHRDGADTRKVL
jgi:hypothetical protein